MKKILVFSALSILLLVGAVRAGEWRWVTKYTYGGSEISLVYDIPSAATVYYNGEGFKNLKVGYAEVIDITKKDPKPNLLRVKETHYNPDGSIMYEGYLYFEFGLSFRGGIIVQEKRIRGKKRNQMFDSWPSER